MGAEVDFDNVWNKNNKIYVVEFYVDKIKYRVARWQKAFALFRGAELILTTKSVSRDLAKEFEKIFSSGQREDGKGCGWRQYEAV